MFSRLRAQVYFWLDIGLTGDESRKLWEMTIKIWVDTSNRNAQKAVVDKIKVITRGVSYV